MDTFKYDRKQLSLMEHSCIPSAVFQFIDNKIVTITLTDSFLEIFSEHDREKAMKLIDNDMFFDCHPKDIAKVKEAAIKFAQKDENRFDVVYRSLFNGKYRIMHAMGKHVFKDGVRLAIVWYMDEGAYDEDGPDETSLTNIAYSNIIRQNEVEQLEKYDFLTGLPTIAYFLNIVDTTFYPQMLERGEIPIMLFLDFNYMTFFNNKYGFAEGDKLIQEFARLISQKFSSQCCCHFGMDRFCVFTNDTNIEERLWELFAETENINNGKSLPVRVGIYSHKLGTCGASYACDRAKMACDSNKAVSVSHFTWFDKSMMTAIENRQYIVDNIERAIKEGWIQVYYQPIVRAASDKVCDEEALSRWIDPVKGFLSPADFIPILEDTKLIYKLDLYVTDQILKKMKEQEKKGLYIVPISVNLSRSDFDACDIVEEIHKRVTEAGISPEKLTIEITESIIGTDYEYMKSQILRFQKLGFNVWMDDFGSGYSSLDVLHDIPFNLIKFDMKFMQQFYTNDKSKIILSGLLKTAVSLGVDTICEGVETEHQVNFLKEVGCTKIQGYYYCQPIPKEKIFERYDKGLQIGFENPDESEYFTSIGKLNLYDLSVITNNGEQIYKDFFNTLPMSILEADHNKLRIVRGNKTYQEFIKKYFGKLQTMQEIEFNKVSERGNLFTETILKAVNTSEPFIVDEILPDGTQLHVYIKRIAVNPVTNVTGILTVILAANGLERFLSDDKK